MKKKPAKRPAKKEPNHTAAWWRDNYQEGIKELNKCRLKIADLERQIKERNEQVAETAKFNAAYNNLLEQLEAATEALAENKDDLERTEQQVEELLNVIAAKDKELNRFNEEFAKLKRTPLEHVFDKEAISSLKRKVDELAAQLAGPLSVSGQITLTPFNQTT